MPELFRPCVAALIQNGEGCILVAERRDIPDSWQFPQGGIDEGETAWEALHRELYEEISLLPQSYEIVEQRPGYRYYLPRRHKRWGKYCGQEQTYFLCNFHGPDSLINPATPKPEFRSWKWIKPADFKMAWLPPFKQDVYKQVLTDFFGVVFPDTLDK